ncbi:hypothetical protein MA16_Dca009672 [Dendrobium catenatum]|uniref:Uncharacterized protein n=1 Tax=Dendrobium catenatum TaxID=906689 RepID=A0A2I0VSP9_9ASPA|nr:hypothetical protein MA16_Dca009672 [Dendrobium catenatum]
MIFQILPKFFVKVNPELHSQFALYTRSHMIGQQSLAPMTLTMVVRSMTRRQRFNTYWDRMIESTPLIVINV